MTKINDNVCKLRNDGIFLHIGGRSGNFLAVNNINNNDNRQTNLTDHFIPAHACRIIKQSLDLHVA